MSETRMLFLGERALAEAFKLIGFETWADPAPGVLDELLAGLMRERANAFVIIDQQQARSDSPLLTEVREEGGRVVVIEVPPLRDPGGFRLDLDRQVEMLTGGRSLDN